MHIPLSSPLAFAALGLGSMPAAWYSGGTEKTMGARWLLSFAVCRTVSPEN